MGKSIILQRLVDDLTDLHGGYFRYFVQVIEGVADAVEINTPFYVFRNILIQLLYLDQSLGEERAPLENVFRTIMKEVKDSKLAGNFLSFSCTNS